jgi:D-lactate dehydrogenase (cytochrome)
MASNLAGRLRKLMPRDSVLDDPLRLALYGYDGTLYEGAPEIVILPETTEQVVSAVNACRDAGVPLVPRGAATSLSGGPVPVRGGAIISFTRMDRVLDLDYANQRVVLQPGVVNLDLQNILAKDRFFYAPDPASQCVCTLGGNVGENSGGPHCLKYGVTANHVVGLVMVLPDGRILRTGGDSLDLTGIIVGSEGTFGLVTEIICRIMPMPEAVVTMLAVFDSLDEASQSVSDIIADGIIPATLEMMDNAMIQAVETALHAGYPLDAEAVLIIELDGLRTGMDRQVKQVERACGRNAVRSFQVAENAEQRALLWKGRKGAFGAVVNIAPSKICTDISVPRSELPKVLAQVMEISRKWEIPITNVFHAGDGNLHPLLLFDPRDEEQVSRAKSADQEITELALRHGGVLTGEHGIGCGKRKYMSRMFGPAELRLMWRIKDAFDPDGTCNPDKVLPAKEDIPAAEPLDIPAVPLDSPLRPENQDELRMILAAAGRDRRRVNRIISYDHENLTITAECGVTLPQIDEVTTGRKQMLALRPRFADRATLGGIIASNDSGPHRLLYGTPRDLLLGIKAALPSGEIVRFGGSCVKNVAGYAVEKLFIGSHGSLGAILEMTLRTLPRPEAFRTVALSFDTPESAAPFLAELLRSGLRPAAVEMLDPAAAEMIEGVAGGWTLLVALEGFAADVDETARRLAAMSDAHKLGRWTELGSDYFELWSKVADLGRAGTPTVRAGSDPTAQDICRGLKSAFDPNTIFPLPLGEGRGEGCGDSAQREGPSPSPSPGRRGDITPSPRARGNDLT